MEKTDLKKYGSNFKHNTVVQIQTGSNFHLVTFSSLEKKLTVKWNGISVLPEQTYNVSVGLQVNLESRKILNESPNGARTKKL